MMSWLHWGEIASKEEVESDEEYESDEEFGNINSLKIHKEYKNVMLATMDIDDFINIPCWAYNRKLDKKRVKELCNGILATGGVCGVFTIVYQNFEYYLIDGQHRQQALIKAIEEDTISEESIVNMPIMALIYNVKTDYEIVQLFTKVNNTKPLTPKDTPDSMIISVVNKLGEDYKGAIHFDKNRTTYPYILAKDLQERVRSICLDDVSNNKLYTSIRKLNRTYYKLPIRKIPNIRSKLSKAAVKKAVSSGFYLGLDEKWSWIEELEEILQYR